MSTHHRAHRPTDVVVVGGGQAGLAMSHCLAAQAVDHVVLERGGVAHSWTTERWDSLRLLTPNWMTRLPGFAYDGTDPNGYMTAAQLAALLHRYGRSFGAPVETGVTVLGVHPREDGFTIDTTAGSWTARAVVIATGAASDPHRPEVARVLPPHLSQVDAIDYRHPDLLDAGPALVVGASASGVQLADELARSGREVTLAVGEHVRVPRTYRGLDIHRWMDAIGVLDERIEDVDDPRRARRTPSLQLIGSPERRTLDLATLVDAGVGLRGRLAGVSGSRAQFSGSLAGLVMSADLKLARLLARIDDFVLRHELVGDVEPASRPRPTALPEDALALDLDLTRFRTVVWGTGFRPRYPFLHPSFLDRHGRLVHDRGVLPVRGAYVLGLPFLRRRKSAFVDGVAPDATELTQHLLAHLGRRGRPQWEESVAGSTSSTRMPRASLGWMKFTRELLVPRFGSG